MSQQKFVEFYQDHLPKHPADKAKLDATKTYDEFTNEALAQGTKAGYSFSKDDVHQVMGASFGQPGCTGLKVDVSAIKSGQVGHELSDDQLNHVSGGVVAERPYSGCCW